MIQFHGLINIGTKLKKCRMNIFINNSINKINEKINNFLPNQYKQTEKLPINHNYLRNNLEIVIRFFHEIKMLNFNTDYTLGKKVNSVEKNFQDNKL